MRAPLPYEMYLIDLLKKYTVHDNNGFLMPVWLVNTIRCYSWMRKLFVAMRSSGWTVPKQLRFRIDRAPDTRFKRCDDMTDDMRAMLGSFCAIMTALNEQLLARFAPGKTLTLTEKEDRRIWKDALIETERLLASRPDVKPGGEAPGTDAVRMSRQSVLSLEL